MYLAGLLIPVSVYRKEREAFERSRQEFEEKQQREKREHEAQYQKVQQERDGLKAEKDEAVEEAEDQEELAKDTALMLDRWQSYADELKKQVVAAGAEPLSWSDFQAGQRA